MAFSECQKKLFRRSSKVSADLIKVNSLFHDVYVKYLYEDVILKFGSIVESNFSNKNSLAGPILLKILGTCNDVDLLLSVVYRSLKDAHVSRLVCNGTQSPFHLLREAVNMNAVGTIPLIFVGSSVKFKYSLSLLDGLLTEKINSILIMFCNESQSFNLPTIVEQSIGIDCFILKNPTNISKDVIYRFFCLLLEELGLFCGVDLLLELSRRFNELRQSFMDLNMILSASVSCHLMTKSNLPRKSDHSEKVRKYLAVLKAFSIFLRMAECLPKYDFRSSDGHDSIGYYIDLQSDEHFIGKTVTRIKEGAGLKRKEDWLRFFEQIEGLFDTKEDNSELEKILSKMKKIKEDIENTKVKSATELMRENLNKSPSRRRPIKEQNYFANAVDDIQRIFETHLQKLPMEEIVNLAPNFKHARENNISTDLMLRDLIEYGCI